MNKNSYLILGAILSLQLSGCVSLHAPDYSPDYQVIDSYRNISAGKFSVETVQPTDPAAKVNNISLRASSLKSASGTFSKYIENALISDLSEMGLYDTSSSSSIGVTVLKNDIDISGLSEGSGILEGLVQVKRSQKTVLEKRYSATTKFESSFVGAVAIPKGQQEYPNLVRAFLQKIYADPEFKQAIKK